jgi:hypothetical protein
MVKTKFPPQHSKTERFVRFWNDYSHLITGRIDFQNSMSGIQIANVMSLLGKDLFKGGYKIRPLFFTHTQSLFTKPVNFDIIRPRAQCYQHLQM